MILYGISIIALHFNWDGHYPFLDFHRNAKREKMD